MKTAILAITCLALISASHADELKPLNAKIMVRGYCFAGGGADKQAFGYGQSDNSPMKLADKQLGKEGEISLVALPTETVPFAKSYRGFRLLLINRTNSEVPFDASDSRVSIIQEALDTHGQWRPIEYLPSSWCGNSYHRVFLPAGHYWEFIAPQYGGAQKTKLRFALQGKQPIHSNEFEGSINPQQFTEKQGHTPTNLMDPYNE